MAIAREGNANTVMYTCAVCGGVTVHDWVVLDTGTTLTCNQCNGRTAVSLTDAARPSDLVIIAISHEMDSDDLDDACAEAGIDPSTAPLEEIKTAARTWMQARGYGLPFRQEQREADAWTYFRLAL